MTMHCSYSPEDNKLRLYATSRLPRDLYDRVKAAGFKWAPKQELFVAPAWTPDREDLMVELCEEIGDEDYSPTERAADRAERFEGYREKRTAEAAGSADTFGAGPSAFGHQNRDRAERQATRHDRHRVYAVSQWSKAEYWQSRIAGVISSALYKSSPAVRRSRILRLEAEQRKHEKSREEYAARFAGWSKVATLEGADQAGRYESTADRMGFTPETMTPALRLAYALANDIHCYGDWPHPRTAKADSLYKHLTDEADPITPAEAAALWLADRTGPDDAESRPARWSDHYTNRLAYERAMMAEEGGSAADADMVPGGWIGKNQIQAVNKSPVTGKVVSVKLLAPDRWYRGEGPAPLTLQSFNIERLPEGAYRAPTEEERSAFAEAQTAAKAERKATTPKAPTLINPTDQDAERLQAIWNATAKEKHEKADRYGRAYEPSQVLRMTQEQYAARSKGAYASHETRTLHETGKQARRSSNMYSSDGAKYDATLGAAVCKIRVTGCGSGFYGADRVIVLTDKPQKALPLDWDAIEGKKPAEPTAAPAEAEAPEIIGGVLFGDERGDLYDAAEMGA
jgi:hypothetical protein